MILLIVAIVLTVVLCENLVVHIVAIRAMIVMNVTIVICATVIRAICPEEGGRMGLRE